MKNFQLMYCFLIVFLPLQQAIIMDFIIFRYSNVFNIIKLSALIETCSSLRSKGKNMLDGCVNMTKINYIRDVDYICYELHFNLNWFFSYRYHGEYVGIGLSDIKYSIVSRYYNEMPISTKSTKEKWLKRIKTYD